MLLTVLFLCVLVPAFSGPSYSHFNFTMPNNVNYAYQTSWPSARRYPAMWMWVNSTDSSPKAALFGGNGLHGAGGGSCGSTTTDSSSYLSDFWFLDVRTQEWSLAPGYTPPSSTCYVNDNLPSTPPNRRHAGRRVILNDEGERLLLLNAGEGSSGALIDMWVWNLDSGIDVWEIYSVTSGTAGPSGRFLYEWAGDTYFLTRDYINLGLYRYDFNHIGSSCDVVTIASSFPDCLDMKAFGTVWDFDDSLYVFGGELSLTTHSLLSRIFKSNASCTDLSSTYIKLDGPEGDPDSPFEKFDYETSRAYQFGWVGLNGIGYVLSGYYGTAGQLTQRNDFIAYDVTSNVLTRYAKDGVRQTGTYGAGVASLVVGEMSIALMFGGRAPDIHSADLDIFECLDDGNTAFPCVLPPNCGVDGDCNDKADGRCVETRCRYGIVGGLGDSSGGDVTGAVVGSLLAIFFVFGLIIIAIVVIVLFVMYSRKKKQRAKCQEEQTPTPELRNIADVDFDQAEVEMSDSVRSATLKLDQSLFEIDYKTIRVGKSLGSGGGGAVVFLAEYSGMQVFKLDSFLTEEDVSFADFEKEVTMLGSCSHESILRFYGACLFQPRVGIVMEYCSNGDLKCYIQANDCTDHDKLALLQQTASGMNFLHSRSILHRDLKPENVLVSANRVAKLCDFGLSRMVKDREQAMTTRIGTGPYMAPELFSGHYHIEVDVFSFGIMMYAVLSSEFKPYGTAVNPEMKVANDPHFRPDTKSVNWSDEIRFCVDLMTKCWDHDPAARPTFQQVLDSFQKSKLTV